MPAPKIYVGLLGKTNVGKSTFFSAATLVPVKIENRPFVTLEPDEAIAYVRKTCVHKELGLPGCTPVSSLCINGERFIPIVLVDLPGLVKDAHKGRGLGNKFLDSIRQADALIHVIDVSGSTDEDGRPVKPGYRDPIEDVVEIENEYDEWMYGIISKDWPRFARGLDTMNQSQVIEALAQRLSGLSITKSHVAKALAITKLENSKPSSWREEELRLFIKTLREVSKPIVIAANKIDIPEAKDLFKKLVKRLPNRIIVPVTALGELMLRRFVEKGFVEYLPGDTEFRIKDRSVFTQQQLKGLELLKEIMKEFGGTGVQKALNSVVFNALNKIVVYPVEDENRYTDSKGNILPDAYLVTKGSRAIDLAYLVHTDLGKRFLYAINAKTKQRVGKEYELKDDDVIKIVAAV
ncbi:redox-regulated ATPase YchF [Ignisphaera sp. 4213-co]|uniref:Redox-regulated ATPase YchF n=1 Tax=Ignisphaera cupida TaxID=3050454 RepID=A0ABD4ZAZ3_9CREN|nr:redox-regulated ATPase YchF [Ignisphaera sp. 4213-co]MDK6029273.1 redox-regulated ATPase YchF [Ignisphaera sp. 4213-co]